MKENLIKSVIYLRVFLIRYYHLLYYGGLLILALCIFLCKDGFGRQSLGRRIMDIKIVHSNSTIKPIRALCRNLFFAILPIEMFLVVLNKKRIGDIICKTDVIINHSSQIQCSYIWQNIFLIIIISTPLLIVYYLLNNINSLLNMMYSISNLINY